LQNGECLYGVGKPTRARINQSRIMKLTLRQKSESGNTDFLKWQKSQPIHTEQFEIVKY